MRSVSCCLSGADAGVHLPRALLPRVFRRSAAAPSIRRSRKGLTCRADVNWDAFRCAVSPWGENGASNKEDDATPPVRQFDFAVVGSGIAGLTYALEVAEYGKVAVITKAGTDEGCTKYAQGGVCAVLDACDSVEAHVNDTLVAGAFLNDRHAVEVVCREGPARVLELVRQGAEFTRNSDGSLHLTKEGGHSGRRIVHAADATGKEIEDTLIAAARAHPNIEIFEHHLAIELVVDQVNGVSHCFGLDVLDQQTNAMCRFVALSTMLSTGGAGQIYPNTTNPSVATGDGIAIAYRAKACVANMEFVQFHPTSLYTGKASLGRAPLVTEAVRGEGGLLYNVQGERFMPQYDSRCELAPRDVVARAIQDQMLANGDEHVLLDISHKPSDKVLSHFPNVAAKCRDFGIDITKDPIPVVPAQHYICGGVQTGLRGETSIQGLYASGEVACTGLHGANRLASNSLLEALVFAHRAVGPSVAHAEHALRNCGSSVHYAAASALYSSRKGPHVLPKHAADWVARKRAELPAIMWEKCGIVRTEAGLADALGSLAAMYIETKAMRKKYGVSVELAELLNMVTVGELVVYSAFQRKESRGLHYVKDYPSMVEHELEATVIETSLKKRYGMYQDKKQRWQTTIPVLKGKSPAGEAARRSLILKSANGG